MNSSANLLSLVTNCGVITPIGRTLEVCKYGRIHALGFDKRERLARKWKAGRIEIVLDSFDSWASFPAKIIVGTLLYSAGPHDLPEAGSTAVLIWTIPFIERGNLPFASGMAHRIPFPEKYLRQSARVVLNSQG
jgi:hypothetical protein